MKIKRLDNLTSDAVFSQIAALHERLLAAGVLARLGPNFLIRLYKELVIYSESAVYVVEENEKIIAFVACTANSNTFYKRFIYRNWDAIIPILLKLVNPSLLKRSFSILNYLTKKPNIDTPSAELLSIAVVENAHRKGIASQLMLKVFDFMHENNVDKFKVTAAQTQQAAQEFYKSKGGIARETIELGKLTSNIFYFTLD